MTSAAPQITSAERHADDPNGDQASDIVVGVDGSDGAAGALRWALDEGARRGWAVTALMAWTYLDQHHPGGVERFDPEYGASDALAALDHHVVAALGDRAAAVGRRVVCDHPSSALVEASVEADLLVVGARGLGGFAGALLGSVSSACVHHATCPVAVIRSEPVAERAGDGRGRVVVGVDDSDTARHAASWAVEEARARHAALDVVHAWTMPVTTVHPLVPATFPVDVGAMEDAARAVIERVMGAVDVRGLEQPVEHITVEGPTARSLLDVAKGADVLVVGSRGRGGFAGLLLGSVSTQVTHHATCPVVVVPTREHRE
jgi:nucleotide-binding universal stress UspA family protein